MGQGKTGHLVEEFVTATEHVFLGGQYTTSVHSADGGEYTGRFWFEYPNGSRTAVYTKKTAPQWMLKMLHAAQVS